MPAGILRNSSGGSPGDLVRFVDEADRGPQRGRSLERDDGNGRGRGTSRSARRRAQRQARPGTDGSTDGQAGQTLAIADQNSATTPRAEQPSRAAESPARARTDDRGGSQRGSDRRRDPSPRDDRGRRIRPATATFNDTRRGGSLVIPPGQGYRQSQNDGNRGRQSNDDRRDRSRSLERKGKGKGKGKKKGK